MTRGATIKVLAVYWALLAFGITMYTAIRSDALATLAPVWIGTFVGTIVGQVLALRSARSWFVLVIVIGGGILWIPQLPESMAVRAVWMAYVPAALCGYWALGDRTSLVAFWFPAVIWMLSILDGTGPSAVPDSTGLILLGALALLFVVFLRVREERRIALWRSVAPTPLAHVKPIVMLHEGGAGRLPRIAWVAGVSALGFAATMWLAPKLWKAETFDGGHFQVASRRAELGLPCCPRHRVAPATRGRLKEYFDLGRGHESVGEPGEDIGCRACVEPRGGSEAPVIDLPAREYVGGAYYTDNGTYNAPGYAPSTVDRNAAYEAGSPGSTGYSATNVPSATGYAPQLPPPPTFEEVEGKYRNDTAPGSPPAPPAPHVAPVPPPQPQVANVPPPPATVAAPQVAPPPAPVIAPPAPVAARPSPPSEAPSHDQAPEVADEAPPEVRAPSHNAGVVLHWAAILLGTLLLSQIIALVLRPVRRAIALRHLERPFWDETVDQRVSNAWQLALIGLRDGGWRTSAHESPVALAKRVDLPGLERCATILERTRHGIGIDHDDLADMTASAAAVYRGARAHATPFARTVAWLRWPLA